MHRRVGAAGGGGGHAAHLQPAQADDTRMRRTGRARARQPCVCFFFFFFFFLFFCLPSAVGGWLSARVCWIMFCFLPVLFMFK